MQNRRTDQSAASCSYIPPPGTRLMPHRYWFTSVKPQCLIGSKLPRTQAEAPPALLCFHTAIILNQFRFISGVHTSVYGKIVFLVSLRNGQYFKSSKKETTNVLNFMYFKGLFYYTFFSIFFSFFFSFYFSTLT